MSICLFLLDQLFDYIAKHLGDFLDSQNLKKEIPLPLGFTFSFPCRQDAIDKVTPKTIVF